jgi:hypothetical protein
MVCVTVIVGMERHKRSATIEVINEREAITVGNTTLTRPATRNSGSRALFADRVWVDLGLA